MATVGQDTDCDLDEVADAIETAFPDLHDLGPLAHLATGASSVVVESRGGHVFRVGRTLASLRSYRKEARLLPAIAGSLGIPVPLPEWIADRVPGLPFGAIGYRKLPGVPFGPAHLQSLDWRRIARQIGEFVCRLHSTPPAAVSEARLPRCHSHPPVLAALWKRAWKHARLAFSESEFERMEGWIADLMQDRRMQEYSPGLVHGDLACWNTLVDESRSAVSGIVDFENACIGDPAVDLLMILGLGEAFDGEVVAAYTGAGGELGAHFALRVRNLRVLRRLYGFVYFGEAGDVTALSSAVRKLRESDLFRRPLPG